MTDWFYILTLTIVGCCDAVGSSELQTNLKHPGSWVKDLRASNRPRKKFSNLVQREPNKRQFSGRDCVCRTEHLVENEIDAIKLNWSVSSNTNRPIFHRNKADRLPRYHRSRTEPINDFDQGINGYDFNNRRLFWEPIFDGKIIGSVGSLFSEDIKNEANSERKERENMRNEALHKKYASMLNDPVKLAELKRESTDSPNHMNQLMRRSFARTFDERTRKKVALKKRSSRNRFDYSSRTKKAEKINEPRSDSDIFFKIINDRSNGPSNRKILINPDNSVPQVRGMPMDFLQHQALIDSARNRKNVENPSSASVYPKDWLNPWMLFESGLNGMDKQRWNSPCGRTGDAISSINSFPILNLLSRGCDLGSYIHNKMSRQMKISPEYYPQMESRDFDIFFQ